MVGKDFLVVNVMDFDYISWIFIRISLKTQFVGNIVIEKEKLKKALPCVRCLNKEKK